MRIDNNSVYKKIPDKLYFKVGEVSQLTDIPAYVLRFWETEFKNIKPKRTCSGQRMYRKKEVKLFLKIKDLLYNKKFTIQGAKLYLKGKKARKKIEPSRITISQVRDELKEIRSLLD